MGIKTPESRAVTQTQTPGGPASIQQSSLATIKDWPWPGGETSHTLLSPALDGGDKGTSWRG